MGALALTSFSCMSLADPRLVMAAPSFQLPCPELRACSYVIYRFTVRLRAAKRAIGEACLLLAYLVVTQRIFKLDLEKLLSQDPVILQPSQLPLGCPDLLDLPHALSCLDSSLDSAAICVMWDTRLHGCYRCLLEWVRDDIL